MTQYKILCHFFIPGNLLNERYSTEYKKKEIQHGYIHSELNRFYT